MGEKKFIAFVADLMFQTRIESTAESIGYKVAWVEKREQIKEIDEIKHELLGTEGLLIEITTQRNPAAMIFDLGNEEIPWDEWIPALKTVPATRQIPVICYGSHVDVDTMRKAKQTGADEVLARSRFVTSLGDLMRKYEVRTDTELMEAVCSETLHPEAVEGFRLFNEGDFFGAHEALENAWKADLSVGRDMYRGILQVAVAYFQIRRRNYSGAIKMFQRCWKWLTPLPDTCRGVNVKQFRETAARANVMLSQLGEDEIDLFDLTLLEPIQWDE